MIDQTLADKIDTITGELLNHEDVDSVQIIVTSYDPLSGDTFNIYSGRGNFFARKQILQDLVDNDLKHAVTEDE